MFPYCSQRLSFKHATDAEILPPVLTKRTGVTWLKHPEQMTNCGQIVSRCCWHGCMAKWQGPDMSWVSDRDRRQKRMTHIFFPLFLLDHLLERFLCCRGTMWLSAPVQLSKFIHHGCRLSRCPQGITLGWILQGKHLCEPGSASNKTQSNEECAHVYASSLLWQNVLHGLLRRYKLHESIHALQWKWLCPHSQFFNFAHLSTLIVRSFDKKKTVKHKGKN